MTIKILIVEDEVMIAQDLASLLTQQGYQVVGCAYDGLTAFDLLHLRNPDLVLLDISLGGSISGYDIADVINDKYKIPFVFITSYSDKNTLSLAKQKLPAGYIVKPFKKKDIIATVEMLAFKIETKPSTKYYTLEQLNNSLQDPLTPKEYNILLDLAQGLSNEDLCVAHFISINTVKTHLKHIFEKLDVKNRTEAMIKILQN